MTAIEQEMTAVFNDLSELRQILWDDLTTAFEAYKSNDTQYSRRVFVRAGICFLEAIAFDLRATVALGLSVPHVAAAYTPREQELLQDRRAFVREYRDLAERFKFALEMMAKPVGMGPIIDSGKDEGWRAFKRALKVRHRITHPVSPSSLEVQPSEILDVGIACHWTARRGGAVFVAMAETLGAPSEMIEGIRRDNEGLDSWLEAHGVREDAGG